jgi:hypothetical protein
MRIGRVLYPARAQEWLFPARCGPLVRSPAPGAPASPSLYPPLGNPAPSRRGRLLLTTIKCRQPQWIIARDNGMSNAFSSPPFGLGMCRIRSISYNRKRTKAKGGKLRIWGSGVRISPGAPLRNTLPTPNAADFALGIAHRHRLSDHRRCKTARSPTTSTPLSWRMTCGSIDCRTNP